ncbi:MAG: D-tyrosyl-tRNA(Tyr) deacylase [Ruminococcaceae bacterium]|nr:D-tyrosyl-tRNA(Tyr) deacylase [Oscillospiraceae bacterium]
MRAVFQRVYEASVTVDGEVVGAIGNGALLLVGVTHGDTEKEARWLAGKIAGLRVFSDSEDRMNLSVKDIGGSLLVVSNFTLYGNASHGRRPEFTAAARPEVAKPLFDTFVQLLKEEGVPVETGVFGADMTVSMQGNGPVTLWLDTAVDARGL